MKKKTKFSAINLAERFCGHTMPEGDCELCRMVMPKLLRCEVCGHKENARNRPVIDGICTPCRIELAALRKARLRRAVVVHMERNTPAARRRANRELRARSS